MKKKGFTLIELIVVLVILAIVVLIAIPIITNIIDKAKDKANKRSIDNYAHAIELAQSTYKLEHGYYTYDIDELKIDYSGTKVLCDDVVLNENKTVYLSKCKIDGVYVQDEKSENGYYTYGTIVSDYEIGEEVTYNGIDFYVIGNSRKSDKYLTLLKKTPIKSNEVIDVIEGTELYDILDFNSTNLSMQYYYNDQCNSADNLTDGCTNEYAVSAVKQIVDGWANKYIGNDLMLDKEGYKSRLISYNELFNVLDFTQSFISTSLAYASIYPEIQQMFKGSDGSTFTMAYVDDDTKNILSINNGTADVVTVGTKNTVRPIVNIKKAAIEE